METTKKTITVLLMMISLTSFSQTNFNYGMGSIVSQVISPTIDVNSEQTSLYGGKGLAAFYINKPITTRHDSFTLGGGYKYSDDGNFSNPELYVSRCGANDDRFRMALIFGMYRITGDNQQTARGTTYLSRRASYAGAALSYHFENNNYFGVKVGDVYDVAYTDGSDSVYYLFEAMTPTAFTNFNVFDNGFEKVSIYAQASYNAVEKTKYTAAVNFENERLVLGAWADVNIGARAKYKTDWLDVQVTYEKGFFVGLIIKDIP